MPFGIIILTRILFAASMVFVIGYVFGNFSKNRALTTITKVASILAIVLFIGTNVFFFSALLQTTGMLMAGTIVAGTSTIVQIAGNT